MLVRNKCTIMNTKWADLNKDGRRLERIIKQMETKMNMYPNLELAYIDRIVKLTHEKIEVVCIVTGVKKLVKKLEKKVLV